MNICGTYGKRQMTLEQAFCLVDLSVFEDGITKEKVSAFLDAMGVVGEKAQILERHSVLMEYAKLINADVDRSSLMIDELDVLIAKICRYTRNDTTLDGTDVVYVFLKMLENYNRTGKMSSEGRCWEQGCRVYDQCTGKCYYFFETDSLACNIKRWAY